MNKVVHQAVIKLGIEEFFVKLRRRANFLRRFVPIGVRHKFVSVGKFVPQSSSYPKNDCYYLTRDQTSFKINRSDYVQWRIFYGVRDNALKYAKKRLESDSIILDIGANCGAFSLKLAIYASHHNFKNLQIHAFEPNHKIFNNYKDNLVLNPAAKKLIQVHPFGFGNETGEKSFCVPESNTGVGKVSNENHNSQMKVDIQRLDDFIDKLNPKKIAFVKLIVEGFEPEVFKGGWNTLKKYKPPIFFEATDEWYKENNSSVKEVLNSLTELGYRFQGERYNELIPYDDNTFSRLYQYNVMAYPTHRR
jgi:FkbM family methyltransferase